MRVTTYSQTVQIKVPPRLLAAVRGAAEREGASVSEYVREAMRSRLREDAREAQAT